jgi:transcriptional antiterminator
MKQTRINVEHRRSLIMELVAKGYTNQRQLASRLQCSPATINRDFEVIAKRAKENLDGWIDSKLPLGFQCLLIGNEMIIKKSWELLERSAHNDGLEERKHQLEILQFLESLYWHKRNYLIDNDNIMLQLTSHQQKPKGQIIPVGGSE